MIEQEMVTIAEATRLTRMSRNTILRRIKTGELTVQPMNPYYKKGGKVAIPRVQVEALAHSQK